MHSHDGRKLVAVVDKLVASGSENKTGRTKRLSRCGQKISCGMVKNLIMAVAKLVAACSNN